MSRTGGNIRIGISGWRYTPWRKTFYPDDLAQSRELEFASRHVNSIEINGTFYSLQSPASFKKWYEQTPGNFIFSAKGGRYLTHMRRLIDPKVPLANFFASGILLLKEKLGPILWQFPPNFSLNLDRFEKFFDLLPRDTESAAQLAARHHEKLRLGTWTKIDENRPLRHAVEIRHPSFVDPAFIKLVKKHNIAMVIADTAGKWPMIEDITADFLYLRLHGAEELYASGYTEAALDYWSHRIGLWCAGSEPPDAKRILPPASKRKSRDVFVYFDNDVKVRAPYDAMSLARRLNLPQIDAVDASAGSSPESPRKSWPAVKRRQKRP
jgi:uncharacterized protein YecE (DUF72 family)